MKNTTLATSLILILTPLSTASNTLAAPSDSDFGKGDNEALQVQQSHTPSVVGTWQWSSHRHEENITFRSNGTYKSEGDGKTTSGTWKIVGNQLFQKPNGKAPIPASAIVFEGNNAFTLDGAFRYTRVSR